MNTKVLLLLALVAVTLADKPSRSYGAPDFSSDSSEEYDDAKYEFEWSVSDESSENHYGHEESRDDDFTQGSYYVQLPDSRVQSVTYNVDGDLGYVAEVSYDGVAQYLEESDEESSGYAPPEFLYYAP